MKIIAEIFLVLLTRIAELPMEEIDQIYIMLMIFARIFSFFFDNIEYF
jgi:hypothetical protein